MTTPEAKRADPEKVSADTAKTDAANAENRAQSLLFADRLYSQVVLDGSFREMTPQARYELFVNKYPNFSKGYPIVAKYMAIHLQYHRRAFERFLDRLLLKPGRGMDGYIETQANYVAFLYEELCRVAGKRPIKAEQLKLRAAELNLMHEQYRHVQKEYDKADNEFKRESARHDRERRQELISFISAPSSLLSPLEREKREEGGMEPGEEDKLLLSALEQEFQLGSSASSSCGTGGNAGEEKVEELDFSEFTPEELPAQLAALLQYEHELVSVLSVMDCQIERLETSNRQAWLEGTSAALPASSPAHGGGAGEAPEERKTRAKRKGQRRR